MRKILRKLLVVVFFTLTIKIYAQELKIYCTKDLIGIHDSHGLDSVLKIIRRVSIFEIDTITSYKIAQKTLTHSPTQNIENFLIDFALSNSKDTSITPIILNYFNPKIMEIKSYTPNQEGNLPMVSVELIYVFMNLTKNEAESMLIKYYQEWHEKSKEYEDLYKKGKIKNDSRLMTPYGACHKSCYLLLLGLKEIKSSFVDESLLDYHLKNMGSAYETRFSLGSPSKRTFKSSKKNKTITLKRHYNSIGNINFSDEPEFINELNEFCFSYFGGSVDKKTAKSYCSQTIIYNEKVGFLELRISFNALMGKGVIYRIELNENTLSYYIIASWIS
jgi:hypothetical protein